LIESWWNGSSQCSFAVQPSHLLGFDVESPDIRAAFAI
jgi:hypothetical protein